MKKFRAILTGALVWVFIFISFTILGTIPTIKDSMNLQALIVAVFIIPFAIFGASVYYKNGNNDNGFVLGIKMVITALILDALITVPFVVIPTGGSYLSFYTFPLLWLLVAVNIATVYLYWKLKV